MKRILIILGLFLLASGNIFSQPIPVLDMAEYIGIEDAGGYYTGTEVEAALQEIGVGYVPYTGAISNVDLGAYNVTTTGIVGTPQIKTDTVIPTDLTITTGAAKTILLATPVTNDMQFQVSDAKVTPASRLPSWEAFTANTSEYAFSVLDEVDTSANEIPHSWKEGTDGHAHMHITTKAVPGAQQYAKFTVTFAYADTDEVWVETPLTAELTIPISTTALTNFYLDLGNLTLTNYLIGAQMRCRIERIAATTGTEYAGDIFITQVGIHFEEDTVGSRQEILK